MHPAWHISTKVLPGNKIEIFDPELQVGDADELPGQRLFKTPEEADQYLPEERSAWEN